ncbi:hypothetical protein V1514DRAFT_326220 [Lipomyces japonicus]|uniref:uncharacterized protein n=1 Tax=Lipomyces japonicus TaxID=56871 RepID=UPI0034CE4FCE
MIIKNLGSTASSIVVNAVPLTPDRFLSFGGVISSREQLQSHSQIDANYGTATKLVNVSPVENHFAAAPSQVPATLNWNLFRSSRPGGLAPVEQDEHQGKEKYEVLVLERHPFSTQTFLPMGISASENAAYIVIVAKSGEDGWPDLNTTEAFVARGDQAVTYGSGTWHAPMVSLQPVTDFAVLIHENGVPNEDCEEVTIPSGSVTIHIGPVV